MAPLRRYIRISPSVVLEARIYLANPADLSTWLLHPAPYRARRKANSAAEPETLDEELGPVLPRVIKAVGPTVKMKVKEEWDDRKARREGKKKGKVKKGVKDVVVGEDFEVSIFLTDGTSRHTVLTRSKTFTDDARNGNGNGAKENPAAAPINVDEEDGMTKDDSPVFIREESEETKVDLSSLTTGEPVITQQNEASNPHVLDEDDSDSEKRAAKRIRTDDDEKKKKAPFRTTFEGYSIWGKVVCLVITRKPLPGSKTKKDDTADELQKGGRHMMENWIVSTQVPLDEQEEDGEDE